MLKYAFQIGPKRSNISATVEGNRVTRGITNTFWSGSLRTAWVKFVNTICLSNAGRHGLAMKFGILPANLTVWSGRFAELLFSMQAVDEGSEGGERGKQRGCSACSLRGMGLDRAHCCQSQSVPHAHTGIEGSPAATFIDTLLLNWILTKSNLIGCQAIQLWD